MLYKLLLNNLKKNIRDYRIFFLTLTISVCIFYAFNSTDDQRDVLEATNTSANYLESIGFMMSLLSFFVMFILAGLIIYANFFFIRRRRREFAIYMILGMSKKQISKLLIIETILVAISSLVVGLLFGILLSQGLALTAACLLNASLVKYGIVISISAIIKTVASFGCVFIFVLVFGRVSIFTSKLNDLLNISRKKQDIKFKSPTILIFVTILAIAILLISYDLIYQVGLNLEHPFFTFAIVLGCVGLFLFFFSISGAILFILKRHKKFYYKGTRCFILSQINYKMMTSVFSITIVSILFFLSISISLSMFTYQSNLEKPLQESLDFDASGVLSIYNQEDRKRDIRQLINTNHSGITIDDSIEIVTFFKYRTETTLVQLLKGHVRPNQLYNVEHHYSRISSNITGDLMAIRNSDYNKICNITNRKPVYLKEDEVMLLSNYDVENVLTDYIHNTDIMEINGKKYHIYNAELIEGNIATGDMLIYCYLIVPDEFEGTLEPTVEMIDFICTGNEQKQRESLEKLQQLFDYYKYDMRFEENHGINGTTSQEFVSDVFSRTAGIIFIGSYLGLIFLVTAVAILALQQLTHFIDNTRQYQILRKIGATDKMISHSILAQVAVYFILPLLVAIINSGIGVQIMGQKFNPFHLNPFSEISMIGIATFILVILVYFYIAVKNCKNLLRQ